MVSLPKVSKEEGIVGVATDPETKVVLPDSPPEVNTAVVLETKVGLTDTEAIPVVIVAVGVTVTTVLEGTGVIRVLEGAGVIMVELGRTVMTVETEIGGRVEEADTVMTVE